jgi:hypothetical protein
MTSTPRHTPAERCEELRYDVEHLLWYLGERAVVAQLAGDAETLRRMQKRLAGLVADVGQGDEA